MPKKLHAKFQQFSNHPLEVIFEDLLPGVSPTMSPQYAIRAATLLALETRTEEAAPDLSAYEPDRQSDYIAKWSEDGNTLGLMVSGQKRWREVRWSVWMAFW